MSYAGFGGCSPTPEVPFTVVEVIKKGTIKSPYICFMVNLLRTFTI